MIVSHPSSSSVAVNQGRLQTFSNAQDRVRLTPTAIDAVTNIAEAWHLRRREAAALLGVSESTWRRIKSGSWKKSLSQDQLLRASAIIGVFHGLHSLFVDEMADRWPRLSNRGPLFENRTPVDAMVEDGVPLMLKVRRHIDALRGMG